MVMISTPGETDVRCCIGIYGVSGVGKTTLMRHLKPMLPDFTFVESSEVLAKFCPDMNLFKTMTIAEKTEIRAAASRSIAKTRGNVVVVGHFSFPDTSGIGFESIFSPEDAALYTDIVYLKAPAARISQQRTDDLTRHRTVMAENEIEAWQKFELSGLRNTPNISLHVVASDEAASRRIQGIACFAGDNLVAADSIACELVKRASPGTSMFLLIDGDRTLSRGDTARAFFNALGKKHPGSTTFEELKAVFSANGTDYPFESFRNAAELYASIPFGQYRTVCEEVGNDVALYPEWVSFINDLPATVQPVLVTSGIRELWEQALQANDLDSRVSVVAGNRLSILPLKSDVTTSKSSSCSLPYFEETPPHHPCIVGAAEKGRLAEQLRWVHGKHVLAFGDSATDEHMLRAADQAFVVVDSVGNRSLKPHFGTIPGLSQIVMLESDPPHPCLPVSSLEALLEALKASPDESIPPPSTCLLPLLRDFTTDPVSKLSYSPSRDASIRGAALCEVHRRMGHFLGDALLRAPLPMRTQEQMHVLGHSSKGIVLDDRIDITILPMMRGGEPLALGVRDRLPLAQFVHLDDKGLLGPGGGGGDDKGDEKSSAVAGTLLASLTGRVVVVVDSVVNSGRSLERVLCWLLGRGGTGGRTACGRVVVMVGVMQAKAAPRLQRRYPTVLFYAMRLSDNSYVGRGGSDTGHRLFCTESTEK